MRVLVYGATGLQAGPIVRQLVAQGDEPFVLTRRSVLPPELDLAGVHLVSGDVEDPATLMRVTQGMDAVSFMVPAVCSDPESMIRYARSAMEAAVAAKVGMFVWNTSGRYPEEGENRPEAVSIGRTWEALQTYGVPTAAVAPAKYMENLCGPWNVEGVRQRNQVCYPVTVDREVGWIAAQDVCAIMAKLLHRPDLSGRIYRLSGPERLAGPQLAEAFSLALGRHLTYYAMSSDEMHEALKKVFDSRAAQDISDEYRHEQEQADPPRHYHDLTPVMRDVPIRMTTVREWVAQHAAMFAPAV
jgi:uncharacterized protein YbjT (DUF2867 family)